MKNVIILLILLNPAIYISQSITVVNHQPSSSISGNWRKYSLGQSFTVPAGYSYCCMNQLVLHMANISANDGFSAELRIYSGNGMSGAVVYGPETVVVNRGINTYNLSSNLSITPGAQYTYELYYPGGAKGGIYAYVMNEHDAANDTEPGGHSWNNRSANTATNVSNYDDLYEIYYVVPLPVTLMSFDANCSDNEVELNWVTASEINNDYFTIERSEDAINYEALETVLGNGNSSTLENYNWIDQNPLSGASYYRLKQTDFDRNYSYSNIIPTNCSINSNTHSTIYPNPVQNKLSFVYEDKSIMDGVVKLDIVNFLGKVVLTKTYKLASVITKSVDLNELPNGVYHVVFTSAETREVQQLVVNK